MWFERAMTWQDVNSRLVFLAHGLVSVLGLVILIVGFVLSKEKGGYPAMVMAVSGGGGLAAIGRAATNLASGMKKKEDSEPKDTDPAS